jgi:WD40 repeat protein
VRLWQTRGGSELACLRGHVKPVSAVAFFPDGLHVLSAGDDGSVRIWDAQGAPYRPLRGAAQLLARVEMPAVHGANEDMYRQGDAGEVDLATFSADGGRIVARHRGGVVQTWAVPSAALLPGRDELGETKSTEVSPNGRRRLTFDREGSVMHLWDAGSGKQIACLRGHEGEVRNVLFSADSRRIVSAGADATIRVWDAQTGAALACLRGHTAGITDVVVSADARRVASKADNWGDIEVPWQRDRTVRLWDCASGDCLEVIEGKTDLAALAAGPAAFPLRAVSPGLETVIESAATGAVIAHWPVALTALTTHPGGRTWAGGAGTHLDLFTLEGEVVLVEGPSANVPAREQPVFGVAVLVSTAAIAVGIVLSWLVRWGWLLGVPLAVAGCYVLGCCLCLMSGLLVALPCPRCRGLAFRLGKIGHCPRCGIWRVGD